MTTFRELLEHHRAEFGQSDYERGRREAIEDTTEWLELTVYPGKRGNSLSRRLEDRESGLLRQRADGTYDKPRRRLREW